MTKPMRREPLADRTKKKKLKKARAARPAVPSGAVLAPATKLHPLAALLGWLLRAMLAAFGAYALTLFLGDAAGLLKLTGRIRKEIVGDPSVLFPLAVLTAAVCLCFAMSRIGAALVSLGAIGGGVYLFLTQGAEIFAHADEAFRCLVNRTLVRLADRGYTAMASAMLDTTYTRDETELLTTALSAIVVVLTVLLSLVLTRRVRPIGCALLCTLLLVPVFVYNITQTNKGVAAVIVFVVGVLTLWMYDRYFGEGAARRASAQSKRDARRAEKQAARDRRRAARERAADEMIAAYDRGGKRADARRARRAVLTHARQEEKQIRAARRKKPPKVTDKAEKRALRLARRRERGILWRRVGGGGYLAALGTGLAMLTLLIPNALVKENFPVIESLDNRIRVARIYATAYLMGDDVDLNGLSLYGGVSDLNPRTVSFSPPRFTGERIFEIESGYNAPVYLRSWIGTEYDLETDSWRSADKDDVLAYRERFGQSFSSDTIGYNFKKYTYPSTADTSDFDLFYGYSRYGFVVTQTNIRRVGGTSRLLFTPTYLNTERGIMEYGSIEPNRYAVSAYYDGVYSSRFFTVPGRAYSAYSYLTTMKSETLAETFDAQTAYYILSLSYADQVDLLENAAAETETQADYTALLAAYEAEIKAIGASYRGSSILQTYIDMNASERAAYRRSFEVEVDYRDYAHENYSGSFGSERIRTLAMQILGDNGWTVAEGADGSLLADRVVDSESGTAVPRHTLILAVLDYLKNGGYTYSLTPVGPEVETDPETGLPLEREQSALETFLFETKEGYCVHFATATAAILREYGLSVRYDEGYLVGDFKKNRMELPLTNFSANVYDYNAHAWIEVYYPLMGWVQYETTPAYMDAMYSTGEGYEITPIVPASERNPIDDGDEALDNVLEEEEETELPLWPFVLGAAVLLVTVAVTVLCLRARRRRRAREEQILDAKNGACDTAGVRKLGDAILAIFASLGCPPETGELSEAYSARIDSKYGEAAVTPFSEIMPLILKAEFGTGLSGEETRRIALYLSEMSASVYAGVSLPRRFYMRYILCVL